MEIINFILLIVISFIASIIGSIIGTAMLILPPAMIFLGIPVHTSVATARFSMVGIGIGNIAKFSFKDRIQLRYILSFAISGVIGSILGASLIVKISEGLLKIIIGILMIIVSFIILFEDYIKPKKVKAKIAIKQHFLSVVAGIFIGAYIGIIGGGGATLVIFLLVLIYGLSFQSAVANQKAITLPMSIIATIVFIYQGLIDYKLGMPLLLVNIAGGWVGAGLVLKFKNIWLKRILVPIIIVMAVKLIFF